VLRSARTLSVDYNQDGADETVKEPLPEESPTPLVRELTRFLRSYWLRVSALSFAVIVPCLWLPHLEAGDEPSHLYNAWLTHLIRAGQTPGLFLVRRSNNVLFDFMLSGLGSIVSWGATEKIAASLAVLVFFWGAFALVCATARRVPWFIVPCLAIFAYGWTFEMGFMNCYLSVGLAAFALAIVVRGRGWERWAAVLLVPFIWMAHPFGLAVFLTFAAYALMAEQVTPRFRSYLFTASALGLVGLHIFIRAFHARAAIWSYDPHFVHDGFNQLLLYGSHSLLAARLLRAFAFVCVSIDLVSSHQDRRWSAYQVPLEFAVLTWLAIAAVPTNFDAQSLQHIGFGAIAFIRERLTTFATIFICCVLGAMRPRKYQVLGFGAIAAIFFFFLYQDTSAVNRLEQRLDRVVSEMPAGQRVITTILALPRTNVTTSNILNRACIGHCYSYDDYEPVTRQFRTRAESGNYFVLTDKQAVPGGYVLRPRDVPLFQIQECEPNTTALCVRPAAAGETIWTDPPVDNNPWTGHFNFSALSVDLLAGAVVVVAWWFAARRKRSFGGQVLPE
jgi:hypothetical protein